MAVGADARLFEKLENHRAALARMESRGSPPTYSDYLRDRDASRSRWQDYFCYNSKLPTRHLTCRQSGQKSRMRPFIRLVCSLLIFCSFVVLLIRLFGGTVTAGPYRSVQHLPAWYMEDKSPNDGRSYPPWMKSNRGVVAASKKREILDGINAKNMEAREACLTSATCPPEQKKIVVVSNRDHHAIVLGDKYGGGETVIARSIESALKWSNYTIVYHDADTQGLNHIVDQKYGGWDNIHLVLAHHDTFKRCTQEANCFYSRRHNKKGAPVWKFLIESLWAGESGHPLGADWILTPEDHRGGGSRNIYTGYSIQESCADVPFIEHRLRYGSKTVSNAQKRIISGQWYLPHSEHLQIKSRRAVESRRVAIIMAKRMSYFSRPRHAFGHTQFAAAYQQLPIRYELGVHNDSLEMEHRRAPDWLLDTDMFENHDLIQPKNFVSWLSTASVLIGIGDPKQSPTPYQALCMGVPFINPIREWDAENPTDRSKWLTQHDGLKYVHSPYVYHVFPNDTTALVAAISSALKNPIDRYIPPWTTQDIVNTRMWDVLHRNYRSVAQRVMDDRRKATLFEL